MELKKIQKWIEAINAYYAFAVLVYTAVLYVTSHSHLFSWVFITTTPLIAGWTGYLLQSFLERRNQRHGFHTISDSASYEIGKNNKFVLRTSTKIKAGRDHLMVFPLGYQWTGGGRQPMPKVTGAGQQVLATVERYNPKNGEAKVTPYKLGVSTEGDWHYWFIALNPPLHKGDIADIRYFQEFHDKKGMVKPVLYYFVRIPMKRLELNVKFPADALPKSVTASYIKASDSRRPYKGKGLQFDAEKQWATWVIDRPKKGYCYRIEWH